MRRLGLVASALFLFVGASLVIAAIPVTQDATYETPVDYAAGLFPCAVVSGDVDLDGKVDLVVANSDSDDVSVLFGNGDGTFQAPSNISTGSGSAPSAVAIADMNGDGVPDIVVTLSGPGEVQTAIQQKSSLRTFTLAEPALTDDGPQSVVVADFNHDGKLDAVTANYLADIGTVSYMQGNGDGTFQDEVAYLTVSDPDTQDGAPYSIATADLNNDGNLDLVVANSDDDDIGVLLGNSNGTFTSAMTYPTGSCPMSVSLGDLNIDGKIDVSVADDGDDTVSILLGAGDGSFQPATIYALAAGSCPQAVSVWDYNLDGRPDVAIAATLPNSSDDSDGVAILRGDGTGAFPQPELDFPIGPEFFPVSLAVGDFNGDFRPDLATANQFGTQDQATSVLLSTTHLVVGDANADGTVTAADVDQDVEEVFDGDGSIVIQVAGGKVASGPGADGNGDTLVTAADFVAIISIIAAPASS